MLRGAMSVTAALPAVPHAVARRARPVRSETWGGGASRHRRHQPAVPERAWTSSTAARGRRVRVSPEPALGPRSSRSVFARLKSSSRDDHPGCAASDPGAKAPTEETVDDSTPRPRGVVNGVAWASARVLELDANVPGWWSFPHERDEDGRFTGPVATTGPPTGAFSDSGGTNDARTKKNKPPSFSFGDDRWTRFVREDLRPPRRAPPPQKLSIAPMMEYTTPHFRHLVRLLTANTWLYTEMEVDQTLGTPITRVWIGLISSPDTSRCTRGLRPRALALASRVAAPYGYDELNLNCGCPSPKVAGRQLRRQPHARPFAGADCARRWRKTWGRARDGEVPRGSGRRGLARRAVRVRRARLREHARARPRTTNPSLRSTRVKRC